MEDLVKVLKALSDETRLRMLMLIEHQELCVCEVMKILGMRQSRVSRHLNILRDAGLARARRQGTWMFYRSAAISSSPNHVRIVEALKFWMKDKDVIAIDLASLEMCIAKRGKDGHCPLPDMDDSKI